MEDGEDKREGWKTEIGIKRSAVNIQQAKSFAHFIFMFLLQNRILKVFTFKVLTLQVHILKVLTLQVHILKVLTLQVPTQKVLSLKVLK